MAGYWSAFTGRLDAAQCLGRGGDVGAQRLTDGGMARGLAGLLGRRNGGCCTKNVEGRGLMGWLEAKQRCWEMLAEIGCH